MGPPGSSPSEPERRQPRDLLLLLLSLLAVAAAYITVLGAQLVWDDIRLIRESPDIHALNWRRAFFQPFWFGAPGEPGSTAYYRPLTTLLFGIDFRVHGENAAGFHLTNLALHLVATGVLFKLLRRADLAAPWAFALATWWGVLPRLSEAVAWISGRGDVLAGALGLCALWAYRPGSQPRLALAGVLALLATLSKEAGLGVFAALLVLEATRQREAQRLRLLADFGIVLSFLVAYAALRSAAGVGISTGGLHLTAQQRALGALEAVGRYAIMLLEPFQSRTFMGELGFVAWPFVPLGILGMAGAVAALWLSRRAKALAYLVMGLTPLALVIHVLPLPVSVVASDRYLYLPTLGLTLALAPLIPRWQRALRPLMAGLLGLVLAGWVSTRQRVADYSDEIDFWSAAMRDAPEAVTPVVELGASASRAGCFPEAWELYMRALKMRRSGTERALDNAALLANLTGRRESAKRLADTLIQRYPNVAAFELRRATIALAALELDEARWHAERALRIDPEFENARRLLASVHQVHSQAPRVISGEASDAERLGFEMRALRYPEALTTLQRLLRNGNASDHVLRAGVQFVLLEGPPQDAQPVVEGYLALQRAHDAPVLAAGLAQRRERAAEVRHKLRWLGVGSEMPREP